MCNDGESVSPIEIFRLPVAYTLKPRFRSRLPWRPHLVDIPRERCTRKAFSSHHLIYPLTARVVGAPQMILRPVSSTFPCSPLPPGTWRTPGLSILSCCLPASSSVCLVFFPLSLCLATWLWLNLMNVRHDHATAVGNSLRWSGGLRVVQQAIGPNGPQRHYFHGNPTIQHGDH